MAFDQTNWLDLWNIWEFVIVGGEWPAIIIGGIIILFFCVKKSVNFQVTIQLLILYSLSISVIKVGSNLLLYAYTVLIVGVISYYLYSKVWKGG